MTSSVPEMLHLHPSEEIKAAAVVFGFAMLDDRARGRVLIDEVGRLSHFG